MRVIGWLSLLVVLHGCDDASAVAPSPPPPDPNTPAESPMPNPAQDGAKPPAPDGAKPPAPDSSSLPYYHPDANGHWDPIEIAQDGFCLPGMYESQCVERRKQYFRFRRYWQDSHGKEDTEKRFPRNPGPKPEPQPQPQPPKPETPETQPPAMQTPGAG